MRTALLDGSGSLDRGVLGGKAWGIVAMRRLGLPVPPAFALPVPECRRYHDAGRTLDDEVWADVLAAVRGLEEQTGRRFGDPAAPLLVSVRSGAPVSMPGMMDTVLNLGVTDEVERGLAARSGDDRFARDTHIRFCHQYGRIVLGADIDAPADGDTAAQVRARILADCGHEVPTDPGEQLRAAICAVFDSWGSRRAKAYRRHWGISEDGGTAVTVQAMVFGNLGDGSGTGVLFSRNPLSGAAAPYGEWLPGGQGEDVVSGTHAVRPLAELSATLPAVHDELLGAAAVLEREHGDVQDIEFTVEEGRLFLLQTRSAKRSPAAAVRTAVDLAEEGLITPEEALRRVTPEQVATLLRPRLAPGVAEGAEVLARGAPACPGVAWGLAVSDPDEAERAAQGGPVVLVRPTTSPDDVAGMIAAQAVVTELGGATSHAAVVTRALGRPSVVGAGAGVVAPMVGREITVDGTAGVVYAGALPTEEARVGDDPHLTRLLLWARAACPVTVAQDVAGPVVDLDRSGAGLDPEREPDPDELARIMSGATAVRGSVLATEAGARAVLGAGVTTVVALPGQQPLVLLLHLLRAAA